MSIENKLTYLDGTKQALKESINNIGGDITNETTFREYAQELDNIYDNLPKTTGESSNLSLNTLKGKMNIIPKGDTQQDTYSGKNLYPSGTSTQTIGGITFTPQENGSLKLQGTSTYSNYYVAGGDGQYVEVANLSNKAEAVVLSVSGMQDGIQVYVVGSTLGVKGIANTSGSIGFTTILNDTYRIFIRVVTDYSVDTTLYIQLEKGSSATSFEPYVGGTASPNPTYPQNIEVVTGDNTIKVENNNLFDNIYEQGGLNLGNDGQPGATATNRIRCNYIKVKPSTTYTISNNDNTLLNGFGMGFYNSSKAYLTSEKYNGGGWNTFPQTFSTPSTCEYIRLAFRNSDNADIQASGTYKVQLEYGSTATTYTPHQEQTQIVSLGNIELCKIGNYQDYLYKTSGKNKFDKTNYEQGYSYTNGSKVANTNWGIYYLTCNANKTYTISGLKAYSGAQIVQLDNSKNIISVLQTRTTANTFTITSTQVGYIGISFVWSTTPSLGSELDTIMINLGSTALPYEPYGSDKWYKKENVYKIANKTNWVVGNIASNNRCPMGLVANGYADASGEGYANINGYSNYFSGISQVNQATTTNINNIAVNNSNIYIKFADTINTRELVKAQLNSMTNLVIYYVLATPNDIEITNETLIEQLDNLEKLKSYNGVTNISSSGNLPMILNVSAIKGE